MTHARDHLREAFEVAVCEGDDAQKRAAAGQVWNCTDTMPASLCDTLDVPLGSTYATGARKVRQ
jgi:hypothetical protein